MLLSNQVYHHLKGQVPEACLEQLVILVDEADRVAYMRSSLGVYNPSCSSSGATGEDVLLDIHRQVQQVPEPSTFCVELLYSLLRKIGLQVPLVVSAEHCIETTWVVSCFTLQQGSSGVTPPSSEDQIKVYDKMATALMIMMHRFEDARTYYADSLKKLKMQG